MTPKLPLVSIFKDALRFPYKHYRSLLKVGLPIFVTGAIYSIFNQFSESYAVNFSVYVLNILLFIGVALSLVVGIIGCHRIFLLGEDVVQNTNSFNWTGNEIRYIGWWILIGVFSSLIVIPFLVVLVPLLTASMNTEFDNYRLLAGLFILVQFPILYVVSRWSLVLPASAISNHGKSLSWSWQLSSENGWRLTLLISILPFLTNLVFSSIPSHSSLVLTLLEGALWLIVGVIEVGILSLSYKFLVANESIEKSEEELESSAV